MARPRLRRADRQGRRRVLIRTVVLLALAALFGCKLNTNPDQVVAIEVLLPDSARVEVTDTFRPKARALNASGDSIAAQVFWSSLDTALLSVVDSTTGASLAKETGTARIQARVGVLRTDPQAVNVLARLDTVFRDSPERHTLIAPDSLSDSLTVRALASFGSPGSRRVVFTATTYPAGGSTVTLLPKDTVFTDAGGIAAVQLRFREGTRPDSVEVTATMRRPNGAAIPGSPVTFVVEFRL